MPTVDSSADGSLDSVGRWEANAGWWQREYSLGADIEYEDQVIPLVAEHLRGARRILDVGCGEGQVARRIAADGAEVVGLDPTAAQITIAHARAGGPAFMRAAAEQLPCRDDAFDAVVVCLALEHVGDFKTALHEVARVLAPDGRFLLLVGHPLLQAPGSGWIEDTIVEEHYWRIGEYLREDTAVDEVAPGVTFEFIHRPIHRYINAMSAAGLLIERMDEPAPPRALLDAEWPFAEAKAIPRLLVLRARHVS